MNKRSFWTTKEDLKLEELVSSNNMSFRDMLVFFPNRTACAIEKRCYTLGLKNRYIYRKYTFDHNCWSNLTPQMSYYAGFIAADGCLKIRKGRNNKSSGGYGFSVTLSRKDDVLVQDLKNIFKYTGSVKISSCQLNGKTFPQSQLHMQVNKKWFDDLKYYWNIEPQKTYRLGPPNIINEYLQFCYLIGYLDGDGCINIDKVRGKISISFVSCGKEILNWIKRLTDKYIEIGFHGEERNVRKMNHVKNCYVFSIGGRSAILLYHFLKHFNVKKLDRKWESPIIDQYLNEFNVKQPDIYKKIQEQSEILYNNLSLS